MKRYHWKTDSLGYFTFTSTPRGNEIKGLCHLATTYLGIKYDHHGTLELSNRKLKDGFKMTIERLYGNEVTYTRARLFTEHSNLVTWLPDCQADELNWTLPKIKRRIQTVYIRIKQAPIPNDKL